MSFAYLPLYTGDYIRDTQHLSCSEHGIYLKLLMHCWDQKGPAPIDERKLCGIVNARSSDEIEALRRVIGEFFVRMEDGHYNKRMQQEIERCEAISEARSGAGRAGANERMRRLRANATQLPNTCQANDKQVTLSPSPSPSLPLTPTSPKDAEAGASVRTTSQAKPRAPRGQSSTADTWDAYSSAYQQRYAVAPVRNATINAQLSQFVGRVGADDAPHVAAFFLTHNGAFYVRSGHAAGALLKDAEKLRTEWATRKQITSTQAMQSDKTQANYSVFAPMIEAARQERLRKEAGLNGNEE